MSSSKIVRTYYRDGESQKVALVGGTPFLGVASMEGVGIPPLPIYLIV